MKKNNVAVSLFVTAFINQTQPADMTGYRSCENVFGG